MHTKAESVSSVYGKDGKLVAMIKRDEHSKKSLVYIVREAKVEEIANLISNTNESES